MNVTADNALYILFTRHLRDGFFVVGNVFDGLLRFVLEISRDRPIAKPQAAADPIENQVQVENPIIKPRADTIEQPVKVSDAVALMAVNDEIAFTVRAYMDGLPRQRDTTESQVRKILQKFVVVAGNVNNPRLLATFPQQFLDEHIVFVAPEPFPLQLPPVNKVADNVEITAFAFAQEIQQQIHLRVLRAEVNVRNPNGAEAGFRRCTMLA